MTLEEFRTRYSYNEERDCLGSGGFADVYRAYDNYLDRYVAVKVAQVKPHSRELRLKNEVERVMHIVHPNIAHYEECFTCPTHPGERDYAIMQYYSIGSLDKLLNKHTLCIEDRYDILVQILEGIAYLHSKGIIHRDLKPANILIATRGKRIIPKIADFGISKDVMDGESSDISNSHFAGTRTYASPEQLRDRSIKKNTDLWSFGIIAYRLIVGKLPYNTGSYNPKSDEGHYEQLRQMTSGVLPEEIENIAEPWQRLIRECLKPDNRERLQSAVDGLMILSGRTRRKIVASIKAAEGVVIDDEVKHAKIRRRSRWYIPHKVRKWIYLVLVIILTFICANIITIILQRDKGHHTIQADTKKVRDTLYISSTDVVFAFSDEPLDMLEASASEYSVAYSLENATEETNIELGASESWISNMRMENGVVLFSVDANTESSTRTATIFAMYDNKLSTYKIEQKGSKVLTLSESDVVIDHNSNTHKVDFQLANDTDTDDVSVVSDTPAWISNIKIDGNILTFTTDANESRIPRKGNITLKYDNKEYNLEVSQLSVSEFTLHKKDVRVSPYADENIVRYSVSKTLDNNTITATTDEDWISNIKVEDGIVSFNTSDNNTLRTRTGKIVIRYGNISKELRVIQATQQRSSEELYNRGRQLYENEQYGEAIEYLHSAAEMKHLAAMTLLGYCYKNGLGVEKNETEGFNYYYEAAKGGYAKAQYNTALCLDSGSGVEKNHERAAQWFEQAANQGHVDAQNNLGHYYMNGIGVKKDVNKGFELYMNAAERGNMWGQFNVGHCYYYGKGVQKDKSEAIVWLRKAAQQGHTNAQKSLMDMGETW